jgi:hypothetical protein
MFSTDIETLRLLVREHQEQLRRDALPASVKDEAPVESAGTRRRFWPSRLRIRLHPARSLR